MGSATAVKLKLHRRNVELDGERFTILSVRPTTAVRFATTEYHESLLVLCDADGVDLLGRLSWAMAFQTRPRTILLIDLPLIAPDPFATSPSDPIVIVNSEYEPPSAAALGALRAMVPLTDESLGSVRLMTAGFDRAVADVDHFWNQERANDPELKQHVNARWVERVSGVVVLAAPTPVLRQWAVRLTEVAGAGPLPAGVDSRGRAEVDRRGQGARCAHLARAGLRARQRDGRVASACSA